MDLQESQPTLPATFNLPQEEPFLVQRYNQGNKGSRNNKKCRRQMATT